MAESSSYPSPNAAHEEQQAYFASQQQIPPTEHVQIRVPPPAAANMRGPPTDPHHYGQATHDARNFGQPSTPQQLAQRGLDINDPRFDSTRKRSKASRACDECRRKKIRCDAESEDPGVQCAACKRAGQSCAFSRAPQKRGPSKGYIKELAERVNLLEYRSGATPPAPAQYANMIPDDAPTYQSTPEFASRKRPFDMVEGQPGYDQSQQQFQQLHQQDQIPRNAQQAPDSRPISEQMLQIIQENSQSLNIYYDLIHPILPLLSHSRYNLPNVLDQIPDDFRNAFFGALDAAISSLTAVNKSLPSKVLFEPFQLEQLDSRSFTTNLAHLQAVILMAIAAENSGPSHSRNSAWLAEAVRIAKFMQLHQSRLWNRVDEDIESPGALGRRAYLILVVLDRWQAASTSGFLGVTGPGTELSPSDEGLLGTGAYRFVRLSSILGHITEGMLYQSPESISHYPSTQRPLLTAVLREELEMFYDSARNLFASSPNLHLAYLHVKLLADRHLESYVSNASPILSGVFQIVSLLRQSQGISPLTHHWASLSAITLTEFPDEASAGRALHDLREGLQTGQIRQLGGSLPWDASIAAYIVKKRGSDRGGLEDLADAAMGKSKNEPVPAREGEAQWTKAAMGAPVDWTVLTMKGYLNHFEQV